MCGLRKLFVMPLPVGNVTGVGGAGAADARCVANDAAPIEISTAFKKLRRETEESKFFVIR